MILGKGYGTFLPEYTDLLGPIIKGKKVFDLGALHEVMGQKLLDTGAESVVAVEKEFHREFLHHDTKLKIYEMSFEAFNTKQEGPEADENKPRPQDVGFVSWPSNYRLPGLLELLEPFETVIYLGKTTDYASCAWPGFFEEMVKREVLLFAPNRINSLIVYGKKTGMARAPLYDEQAGIDLSRVYTTDEAIFAKVLGYD